jgi:hypothetical protein
VVTGPARLEVPVPLVLPSIEGGPLTKVIYARAHG